MNSGIAHMVTRREVLGAALALATFSGAIGLNSIRRMGAVKDQSGLPTLDAIMLDEGLGVSTALVDLLHNRQPEPPLLTIRLDSFASIELKHIFNSAQVIAGISSGATLFCLERIAWDYGYRITRRSEHQFNARTPNALENDATVLALADKIMSNRPESFAAALAPASRAYRPSSVDDTLHAWIMQTAVTSKKRRV